jgi:hypothetical protein
MIRRKGVSTPMRDASLVVGVTDIVLKEEEVQKE